MKGLTVYQPWATLIALEVKPYEFRGHDYSARNSTVQGARIAIHASAREPKYKEIIDLCDRLQAKTKPAPATPMGSMGGTGLIAAALPILLRIRAGMEGKGEEFPLPRSAIVCLATLGKAVRADILFTGGKTNDSDRDEHALYAWPMLAVKATPPIPCKGLQGFWNVPASVERELFIGRHR